MLTADLDSLLKGTLAPDEAGALLSSLTPENTSATVFAELIKQIRATGVTEFERELSGYSAHAIDCCGTGGSGRHRFNTSTAVAFVLAAAGAKVVKFGNRAATSSSGSFDVLECLGLPAMVAPAAAARLLSKCGLVFLFAPQVYPQLAALAPLRRAVGRKTVLNFCGPLLNPANPACRLIGVSDPLMQERMREYLAAHQPDGRAALVYSSCGLDEICPDCACSTLTHNLPDSCAIEQNGATAFRAHASVCSAADGSSTAKDNARTMLAIFGGEDSGSCAYRLVVSNAAAALVVAGISANISDAALLVRELLQSGKVRRQFHRTRELYESLA